MEKLDKIFSEFTRLRDADSNGYVHCYCCGYSIAWTNSQAMHFMNRRHLGTRFNEINVKAGCQVCNMHHNGNLEAFEQHLIRDYGEEVIDRLTMLKNTIHSKYDIDIEEKTKYYAEKVKQLKKEKGL